MKKLMALLLILYFLCGCTVTVNGGKLTPEHTGIDSKAMDIYNEYIWLSTQNNIKFQKNVTIGFKKINRELVAALCTSGSYFREIDVDEIYWSQISQTSRMTMLFHELTHCLCGRKHDYGPDKKYPMDSYDKVAEALEWKVKGGPRPGFWRDGCPVSIMYPSVVDDSCMKVHYPEYTAEMFNRCKAW